jgi:hypothetical protein
MDELSLVNLIPQLGVIGYIILRLETRLAKVEKALHDMELEMALMRVYKKEPVK